MGRRSARHVKREIQLGTTLKRWKDTCRTRGVITTIYLFRERSHKKWLVEIITNNYYSVGENNNSNTNNSNNKHNQQEQDIKQGIQLDTTR